jgi:hypothetical protein
MFATLFLVSSLSLGSASPTLQMALASHNIVHGLYPAGRNVRQAYAYLIQSDTCQRHTMYIPDPPQIDKCQPHTMCSFPRRSDLTHARVNIARMKRHK